MNTLNLYLGASAIVFALGLFGVVLNRNNLIVLLMCIELMLLAVATNFIVFSTVLHQLHGDVFVFFILAVAAAESAIGLAILVSFYRKHGAVTVDQATALKG